MRMNISDLIKIFRSEAKHSPRPFAFPYILFFLNLEQGSMSDILTALQKTSRLMQSDHVIDLRNSFAHGNHPLPDPEIIDSVLDRISRAAAQLKVTGFYPRTYELQVVSRDDLGREELTYQSGDDIISMFRPSWAIAPKLPLGDTRLIIMPIAKTVASGPLRFLLRPWPGSIHTGKGGRSGGTWKPITALPSAFRLIKIASQIQVRNLTG